MATNPMQRKARNSFLLGMVVMLLISGVILALMFVYLMSVMKQQKEIEESYVDAYVLNKNVESGQEVTAADFTPMKVAGQAAPKNLTTPASFEGTTYAKLDMTAGTVLAANLVYNDNTATGNDVRTQEYNMVVMPMDLITGDYIDIRLQLPSGQDYIVVSKKQVTIPMIAGVDSNDTMTVNMSEAEILMMSNAIVDAYRINGSKLYATKYTEPGNQEASKITYVVSNEVAQLVNTDKNIVDQAGRALVERYNGNAELRTNYINAAISSQADAQGNEENAMNESITNSQTSRQQYLQSLTAVPTE